MEEQPGLVIAPCGFYWRGQYKQVVSTLGFDHTNIVKCNDDFSLKCCFYIFVSQRSITDRNRRNSGTEPNYTIAKKKLHSLPR